MEARAQPPTICTYPSNPYAPIAWVFLIDGV